MAQETAPARLEIPHESLERLIDEIAKVYVGERSRIELVLGVLEILEPWRIELVLVALLAGGHAMIEDVPGVGKTVLAQTIARALESKFRRIQFTSDLLPTDLLGVNIYDQNEGRFVFRKGPLFANIVLADEINRTTPRTQSSLLEAMSDGHITVDGITHYLPQPFCVLATQNPFEFEGTYPLPESQLDRFFIRMTLGYPTSQQSRKIIRAQQIEHPIDSVQPVMTRDEVLDLQKMVRRVHVSDEVLAYIVDLVEATRRHEDVAVGVSPRGGVHLNRAAQALALVRGREYVEPDDVKDLAVAVLAHRMRCHRVSGTRPGFSQADQVIEELLDQVPVPL
jgi:MoxR-like ATPase